MAVFFLSTTPGGLVRSITSSPFGSALGYQASYSLWFYFVGYAYNSGVWPYRNVFAQDGGATAGFMNTNGSIGGYVNAGPPYITADKWCHLGVTMDVQPGFQVYKHYIDGMLHYTSTGTTATPPAGTLVLGASNNYSAQSAMNGYVRDFRSFSRILRLDELIAESKSDRPVSGSLLHWHRLDPSDSYAYSSNEFRSISYRRGYGLDLTGYNAFLAGTQESLVNSAAVPNQPILQNDKPWNFSVSNRKHKRF